MLGPISDFERAQRSGSIQYLWSGNILKEVCVGRRGWTLGDVNREGRRRLEKGLGSRRGGHDCSHRAVSRASLRRFRSDEPLFPNTLSKFSFLFFSRRAP